ncbi:MAG: hypothetical protein K2X34_05905 [Hyphomonadaceae bacterium]|nr:hypothetical protein [Hyphomonadaceae bacterium]
MIIGTRDEIARRVDELIPTLSKALNQLKLMVVGALGAPAAASLPYTIAAWQK